MKVARRERKAALGCVLSQITEGGRVNSQEYRWIGGNLSTTRQLQYRYRIQDRVPNASFYGKKIVDTRYSGHISYQKYWNRSPYE